MHSGAYLKHQLAAAAELDDDTGTTGIQSIHQSIKGLQLASPTEDSDANEFSDDEDDLMLNPLLPKSEVWVWSMKFTMSNRERMMLEEQVTKGKGLVASERKAAMVAESTVDHEQVALDYSRRGRGMVTDESLISDLNDIGAGHPKSREEADLWDDLAGYQEVSYEDSWTLDTLNAMPKKDIVNLLIAELRDQATDAHIAKMQAYLKTRK